MGGMSDILDITLTIYSRWPLWTLTRYLPLSLDKLLGFFCMSLCVTCLPHTGESCPLWPPLVRCLLCSATWSHNGHHDCGSPVQPAAWRETAVTPAGSGYQWPDSFSELSPECRNKQEHITNERAHTASMQMVQILSHCQFVVNWYKCHVCDTRGSIFIGQFHAFIFPLKSYTLTRCNNSSLVVYLH